MNFKNFREHIYELDHFVRMVASVFVEHRYVECWARKYKRFDEVHESSLLSLVSNVIKRFIQLAKVIIGVNFLPRFIYFELLYTNFSVGVFHITIWSAAQILRWANIISILCRLLQTHISNTHKLNVSVAPWHRFLARIRSLNGAEGLRSSTFQDNLLNK